MVVIKKLDDMKKMINKICLFLFIALIAASCEDFPVDEDLDIVELNKVLEYNFEELKDVYEGE